MRQLTYYAALLYVIVLVGTLENLGDLLGSFVRLAGLPLMGLWVLGILGGKKIRRPGIYHLVFGSYIVWNFLSFFWTVDEDQTMDYCTKYFYMFGTAIVLWDILRTRAEVNGGLQAFVLGLYVILLTTLQSYAHGANFSSAYENRYAGAGYHPNSAGFLLAIGVPVAWYLATQQKSMPKFFRVINYLYPLLAIVGIVLTASRGGFIACFPGYLYIVWSLMHMKTPGRIALAIAVAGLILLTTRIDMSIQIKRLSESTQSGSTDHYSGRPELWAAAKQIFYLHPLLGVGAGGFRAESINYNVPKPPSDSTQRMGAHNTYLEVLSEQGIVGFLLFMSALGIVIASILKHPRESWLPLFVAFVSFPVAMSYEMIEWRPFTWLFFSLIVISGHAQEITAVAKTRVAIRPPSLPETTSFEPTYGI